MMRKRTHHMNRYIFSLFMFIYMHYSLCFKIDDRQTLRQEISGNGFHRALHYYVKMQQMDRNCSFMIVQQVPVNFFIDMDELQNLKAFGGPSVATESAVDTEQPSYNAKEHTLYIHPAAYKNRSTTVLFEVLLPIHARYQKPVPSGNNVIVAIENGRLYSNCSASLQTEEQLMDICNGNHAVGDACKWRFLHEFTEPKEGRSVKIPTGNTDHAIAVTVITLLTTSMLSIIVLRVALRC